MINTELLEKIEKLSPELQSKVEETVDQLLIEEKACVAENQEPKLNRKFGELKGLVIYMADDFDEPLEDFKDYM